MNKASNRQIDFAQTGVSTPPKLVELLRLFGDEDAMRIFSAAGAGLSANVESVNFIGLTRKRYYDALKPLVSASLVSREDMVYVQTAFGVESERQFTAYSQMVGGIGELGGASPGDFLDLLRRPNAMRIFEMAREGFNSKKSTHKEMGIGFKAYYTRLKQLVDMNLIEKQEEIYTHTGIGFAVNRFVCKCSEMISKWEIFKMAEIVIRSGEFEREDVMQALKIKR